MNTNHKEKELSTEINSQMGTFPNTHTVRIERLLPGPIDSVWGYFTDTKRLGEWLMPGVIENKQDGLIEFVSPPVTRDLVPSVQPETEDIVSCGLIDQWDPPKVLSYSWNESVYDTSSHFKIELKESDGKVLLVMTHSHLDPEWMVVTATGWHASLETLIALLKGEQTPDIEPLFVKLLSDYKVLVASAGIVVVATTASPAMASELSDEAYKQVKAQKHELLMKYDRLWKDAKNLQSDISRLEKASGDNSKTLDALHRDLKYKKKDMRGIELDVRDLDKVLR